MHGEERRNGSTSEGGSGIERRKGSGNIFKLENSKFIPFDLKLPGPARGSVPTVCVCLNCGNGGGQGHKGPCDVGKGVKMISNHGETTFTEEEVSTLSRLNLAADAIMTEELRVRNGIFANGRMGEGVFKITVSVSGVVVDLRR